MGKQRESVTIGEISKLVSQVTRIPSEKLGSFVFVVEVIREDGAADTLVSAPHSDPRPILEMLANGIKTVAQCISPDPGPEVADGKDQQPAVEGLPPVQAPQAGELRRRRAHAVGCSAAIRQAQAREQARGAW